MALKLVYDDKSQIPSALVDYYEDRDGKWCLATEADPNAPDVGKLTRAIEHERKQRADAIKARETLQAEHEAIKAKLSELEAKGTDPDADRRLEQYRRETEQRIASLEKMTKASDDARAKAELDLAEQGLVEGLRKFATPLIREDATDDFIATRLRPQMKRLADSGQWVPHDESGPRYSPKEPTRYMTSEEFVRWAADQPNAKYMLRPSTGGRTPGSGEHRNDTQFTMTRAQAKDFPAWERARAAAEKAGQELKIVEG